MTTKIEWSDETWNPIIGCSKISEGCQNCYAERMANRLSRMKWSQSYKSTRTEFNPYMHVIGGAHERKGLDVNNKKGWGWHGNTVFYDFALIKPLHWKKPRKIFACSMGDLFHESVPFEWIDKVMATIALCPQHTFQILTKRPERMAEYFGANSLQSLSRVSNVFDAVGKMQKWDSFKANWPLPNLWLGVTAENQQRADERIPILKRIPAVKHFASLEPLLSEIDFRKVVGLDWVIVGCETGHGARPCKIEWIESIVKQCKAANVPVFVKQIPINSKPCKDMSQWPEHLRVREFPK